MLFRSGHSTMPWQQQDGCKSMLPRQGCNLDVHDKKGLGMHMNHTEMHTAAHQRDVLELGQAQGRHVAPQTKDLKG